MCAFLPHELFAALFNDYGPFWEKVMLGKKTCSEMSDFWARAKTHACIQDCPADSPDRVVPLAVIGDEVPVVGRSKVWCANRPWSCLGTACGRPHLNTKAALQKICTAFEAKTEALYWQASSFTNKNGDIKHRSKPLHARRTAVEPVCAGRNGSKETSIKSIDVARHR